MNPVPLLLNHDYTKVIGWVREMGGDLIAEFNGELQVTREMLFDIFGGGGVKVLEEIYDKATGVIYIKRVQFVEFSWSQAPAREIS